ncbi:MAG TPA: TonB-dependent receptor plug domain-containing protein, partial [Mucilaginibacter sp.]
MLKRTVFWLIFLPLVAFGQQSKPHAAGDTAINALPAGLAEYYATYPTEKAYLQFDKPYYAIGDTVYFKAYVVIREQHKLSALSGVLNVDLINPDNKIVRTEKLQLIAGVAWADFVLADSLKSGNYRIRAHTNWMRNEGEDSFFEQIVPVEGVSSKKAAINGSAANTKKSAPAAAGKSDIQFLPEGGSLVTGNYSKMAFKAIAADGFGTPVKGVVTDDTGTEICRFESTHLGMGAFNFVPETGRNYKANITYADGQTSSVSLPRATNSGYTLSVNNNNPDTVRIRVTGGSENTINGLTLVGQAGGVIYYAAENQSAGRFFSAVIPKNKFPTGVIQFTLFSKAGEPLNERLAFINHKDQLKLDLNTAKINYEARQKVSIALNVKDKTGKPATGSFSVAVVDETLVPADSLTENNILTNLLLTSELKGTIEQPNYYFINANDKARDDLDNLMLTQGYRHFDWKKVLGNNQENIKYQAEKAMQISGIVKKGHRPVPNAKVKLFSTAGGMFMLDTLTAADGRFSFNDLIFQDSTKFVVQAKVSRGQDDVTLQLDTLPPAAVAIKAQNTEIATNESAGIQTYVNHQKQFFEEQQKYGINKHAVMLKEVHVDAKYVPKIPHSDNLNGSGQADQVITAQELEKIPCVRIVDCLGGLAPLVRVGRDGSVTNMRYGGQMAIVIDGNFVEPSDFAYLPADDIEGIEVIMGAHYGAIYGSRMVNGGIIVTTKRAKKQNQYYRYAPGVVTYMPKGFYKAREFYSPQYDNPHTNQKMADLRSTIYWNPNIITD